jgi:rhodanese-related sulfurtransferase
VSDRVGGQPNRMMTAAQARQQIEDGAIQVIDVRPPFDFAGGHIPRSLSLPGQALRNRAAQLPRDRALLIVGADQRQIGEACALAASLGFTAVFGLDGGFDAWLAAGYPIHTISDSMAG